MSALVDRVTPEKRSAEAAARLASLNLSTPAALRDASQEELAGRKLSGYEAMRKIRDDAAQRAAIIESSVARAVRETALQARSRAEGTPRRASSRKGTSREA